jgi:hypothetical protein
MTTVRPALEAGKGRIQVYVTKINMLAHHLAGPAQAFGKARS